MKSPILWEFIHSGPTGSSVVLVTASYLTMTASRAIGVLFTRCPIAKIVRVWTPKYYALSNIFAFSQFPYISGVVKNCFWAIAIIVMTIGLCYNLNGLTMNYLRRSVTVSISLVQQKQIVFPAVTVCNLNPIRKSALDAALEKYHDETRRRRKRQGKSVSEFDVFVNVQL